MTEFIDIVNENDEVVSTVDSKKMQKENLLHRSANVIVFNSKQQIFVHQRSARVNVFPLKFDIKFGGSVRAGESYEEAAKRELHEEAGIKDTSLIFMFRLRFKSKENNVFRNVYSCFYDGEIKLDPVEVKQGRFMDLEEIKKLKKQKKLSLSAIDILDQFLKNRTKIKKVLVLGSGALKIGEAGEFDYSGSQAIKALKEEGIKTVLVNPNIATIQTSKFLSDTVYFLPVNEYFVEQIIKKEKPDGILLSFGGQTALNCGLSLYKKGIFKKYGVEVLGTPVSAILLSEDRKRFADHLRKINVSTPPSKTAKNFKEAQSIARKLGFPVMIRAGFALGGQGSGIAKNEKELKKITEEAFAFVKQILVEKYLHHYKEVEYEVVRDKNDNCITVCNMENMDPLGIHTGESIVVAPSQTLTNYEYHALRHISIEIVRSLKIVGECNVQFALNPNPRGKLDYYVIELNARLSRSSALASKATGYPLAYVAAKLALGKNLTDIKNKVTHVTQSCFEPSLDYIVVKIPRWDIEKFKGAEQNIGSSMKSVGEVMGIGRTFEEAYQKAIRMLDLDFEGATNQTIPLSLEEKNLTAATPKRMFAIAEKLRVGTPVKKVYKKTGIDPWFLYRIKNIVEQEQKIKKKTLQLLSKEELSLLKKLGFSDKRIGELVNATGLQIRGLRKKLGIIPYVFQIDTLSGEFPARTNYLYMTYNGSHHDVTPSQDKGIIVLGSGPYRIGSSVEFDWTSVNTVLALQKYKKDSIIINCNPETVSTDYDISNKLYFEELTFERIADIYDFEKSHGIIVSVGGQTPNNRAKALSAYGCNILGTSPKNIDRAEDRTKFSKLLDKLSIQQPPWNKFASMTEVIAFCQKEGYPVLIRPSYVLSGTSMNICNTEDELRYYLERLTRISEEYPITVSKFIQDAQEIELDAVAQNGTVFASVISEHIEQAGVHSGDATILLPAQTLSRDVTKKLNVVAEKLAEALSISGPFNIQFLVKEETVSVIEANLRSSRTFPFVSKVTGVNFIDLAVDAFFNKLDSRISMKPFSGVAVKVAQFSFARLKGADPFLYVEMSSTGEVACFGKTAEEAYLKGEIAVGGKIPTNGIFISIGGDENKNKFLPTIPHLKKLSVPIYATEKTAEFLNNNGVKTRKLHKIYEGKSPTIIDYFQKGNIDVAINIPEIGIRKDVGDGYIIRRTAVDHNIHLFTNIQKAELFIRAVANNTLDNLAALSWDEYTR